jgi:maleylacetoacetate isomerase
VNRPALYSYWRSSAAYRVRIALNLKGVAYECRPVHLVRDGGEQRTPEYLAINPQGLVPVLSVDGLVINQSLAIIEYADERWPDPPLLPADATGRARVRSLAMMIACDIHPLNNSRVQNYLRDELGVSEEDRLGWYRHWVASGFEALEVRLGSDADTGRFCHGNEPGLADLCLVPQIYNAQRFRCDMSPFPSILAIHDACMELDAFRDAAPEAQPDAE